MFESELDHFIDHFLIKVGINIQHKANVKILLGFYHFINNRNCKQNFSIFKSVKNGGYKKERFYLWHLWATAFMYVQFYEAKKYLLKKYTLVVTERNKYVKQQILYCIQYYLPIYITYSYGATCDRLCLPCAKNAYQPIQ